jgi:hypothetical protein
VELPRPDGFDPERLETWPRIDGRLEYVAGRLQYRPPTTDIEQYTAADVVSTLVPWTRSHPGHTLGAGQAGMLLAGDVRAAVAAIWRKADLGPYTGGLRRVPPLLAVEVAGRDDTEAALREKADWYLAAGVATVWLVLPESREVIVVTPAGPARHDRLARLPESPSLPGLGPQVAELFVQIDAG